MVSKVPSGQRGFGDEMSLGRDPFHTAMVCRTAGRVPLAAPELRPEVPNTSGSGEHWCLMKEIMAETSW